MVADGPGVPAQLIPTQVRIKRQGLLLRTRHSAGNDVDCLFNFPLQASENTSLPQLFGTYYGASAGISAGVNLGAKMLSNQAGVVIIAANRLMTTAHGTAHSLNGGVMGSAIEGQSIDVPQMKNLGAEFAANERQIMRTSRKVTCQIFTETTSWDELKSHTFPSKEETLDYDLLKDSTLQVLGSRCLMQ